MAKERVIHIGVDLDTSGMLSGINQMRQMLGSISVDSKLFKDVNKDLDKITKDILEVKSSLKNGIPEKGVTSFLTKIESINKIYSALPDKIRQVQINTQNIRLSDQVVQQLETLDQQIIKLGEDAKKALGENLKASLRNAIPKDVITDATLKSLTEAVDKTKAFSDYFDQMADSADAAKAKVASSIKDIANTIVKNTDANASKKRTVFSQFGTAAMNALQGGAMVNVDAQAMAQNAANIGATKKQYEALQKAIVDYQTALQNSNNILAQKQVILDIISKAEAEAAQSASQAADLTIQKEQTLINAVEEQVQIQQQAGQAAETNGKKTANALNQVSEGAQKATTHLQKQDSLLKQLASRATSLIGIGAIFNYITRAVRDAWNGIRDLDKEFTQIAVVTDKTTSELWQSFTTYSQMAQGLGVTTKDAVATSALYYQQGLKTADVMTLTAETIKMAQIAGMDFATATNQMTAAIRGFNLEMSDASKVNDIFSTLAASAAVSTQELAYALTKTASIAESAGMSIDTTSAFLTKMIETTREAPENIGTAMKSIVARFEELKKNPLSLTVEVDGEEVVANKVESAIALAGVALRDAATGQFRDLDEVFLELAKAWDGLDRNTQRYIATIAAGSRQQSRFIAMMDGYERTLELVELAQDSEGQSAAQFLKTLDSLDSKLNKISNSLESLYQKFVNSEFFGGLLDGLNDLLQGLGKLDASTLAIFGVLGITIGSKIIQGIIQSIGNLGPQMTTAFTQRADKIKEGIIKTDNQGLIYKRTERKITKDAIKKTEKALEGKTFTATNKTGGTTIVYDLDTIKANKKLTDVKNQIKELDAKIKADKKMGDIDTTSAENKLKKLKEAEKELAGKAIIKDENGNALTAQKLTAGRKLLKETEEYKQFAESIQPNTEEAIKKAQEMKAKLVTAMGQVGPAMVSALSIGITTAFTTDDPFAAMGAAAATFASYTLPNIFNNIATAIAEGRNVIEVAGGWMVIAIKAIVAIASIVLPGAIGAIKKWARQFRPESEKLQEEISQLEDKIKDLEENSEKLTAEAAVEKTKNKNINNLIKSYDELINKVGRTTDENERLDKIINDLATDFPDLVSYYDEAGNAVLRQRKEWEKIKQIQEETAKNALQESLGVKLGLDYTNLRLEQDKTKLSANLSTKALNEIFSTESPYGSFLGGVQLLRKAEKGDSVRDYLKSVDFNNKDSVNELKKLLVRYNTSYDDYYNYYAGEKLDNFFGTQSTERFKKVNEEFRNQGLDVFEKILEYPALNLIETSKDLEEYINTIDNKAVKTALSDLTYDEQKIIINNLSNFYDDINDQVNNLNTNYQSDELKQKIKQVEEDLKNYFIQYAQSFETEMAAIFGQKGLERLGQAFAQQQSKKTSESSMEDFFAEKSQGINSSWSNIIDNEAKKRGIKLTATQLGQLDKLQVYDRDGWEKIRTEGNEEQRAAYDVAELIYQQIIAKESEKDTEEFNEELKELIAKSEKSEINKNIISMIGEDYGNYSTEDLNILLESIRATLGEGAIYNVLSSEIDTQTKELEKMSPAFKTLGETYGYNIAQGLIDKGVSDEVANSVNSMLSNISPDKVPKIINTLTQIDDWGNLTQLKQLGQVFIEAGLDADTATQYILKFKEVFTSPINLQLNLEKATSEVTDFGKSLNDLRKGFDSLKSAMEEFDEAGRLSGETILNLIENGHIQYLELNKQTGAITINKDAMENYYELQISEIKAQMLLKKQEALQSLNELKQKRETLSKQLDILLKAKNGTQKITQEEYNTLLDLQNQYGNETENINNSIVDDLGEFWKTVVDLFGEGFSDLDNLIKTNGAVIAQNLEAALTGDASKFVNLTESTEKSKQAIQNLIDNSKKSYYNPYAQRYELLELREEDIDTAIAAIREEIGATDELIEAQTEYYELIEKGYDIADALTESGLDNFINDTAAANKKANEELEKYVSTLERYYTLQKRIQKFDNDSDKYYKRWKKTGSQEDFDKWRQNQESGIEAKGQLAYVSRIDKDRVFDELKKDLSKWFNAEELSHLIIDPLTGLVDQDKFYSIIEAKSKTLKMDDQKEIDNLFKDALVEIEKDQSNIDDYDSAIEAYIDNLNSIKEELDEIKKSIDKLANITQAIASIEKILEDAKESNEEYYKTGEGINGLQYLKTIADTNKQYEKSTNEISTLQTNSRAEISSLTIKIDGKDYNAKDFVHLNEGDNKYYKTPENYDEFISLYATDEGKKFAEVIEKLTEDYNSYTDEVKDNTSAILKNKKAQREFSATLKQSYADAITKLADDMAKLDQKEIDEVKKKYQMIQDEDDKYLDALQKSIDKQRRLRDQANSYDDLEKDEKRLALLERDTSGANAAEIAALKEQIKDARQQLVDTEQDNIVNSIAEDNQLRKDRMNEETEFLQNVMDERTYDMQYYFDKARDIVDAALNGDAGAYRQWVEIYQKANEDFYKNIKENQDTLMDNFDEQLRQAGDWNKIVTEGYGELANGSLSKISELDNKLSECKDGANEFDSNILTVGKDIETLDANNPFGATKQALDDMIEKISQFQSKLKDYDYTIEIPIVYTETGDVPGGKGNLSINDKNKDNYRFVYDSSKSEDPIGVISTSNSIYNKLPSGSPLKFKSIDDTDLANKLLKEGVQWSNNTQKTSVASKESYSSSPGLNIVPTSSSEEYDIKDEIPPEESSNIKIEIPQTDSLSSNPLITKEKYYAVIGNQIVNEDARKDILDNWVEAYNTHFKKDLSNPEKSYQVISGKNLVRDIFDGKLYYRRYSSGGIVDYTGPAWVDGTPANPEAFLSAEDTRNIQTLTEILSTILTPASTPNTTNKSEVKTGDTNIEIHIDIEQISDDYDVDQMLDVIQERISEASEGNVTIVK